MITSKEVDNTYRKYKNKTNMSYTELLIWSKNPASKMASLSRKPILRNLKLLKKPKKDWTASDLFNANKTISFISRMRKVKSGKKVSKNLSKRDISLLNWAYNPYK
jgi:hypothetical protein